MTKNKSMTMQPASWVAAAALTCWLSTAWAEETTATPVVDHSKMDHGSAPPATGAGAGNAMDMGAMQGGSAPPDARDPHAWSGGYTLDPARPLRMGDEHNFHSIMVDRLEAVRTRDRTSSEYELQASFGRDYNRAVLKAEGEVVDGRSEEAHTELLWGHAVATYWDTQLGVRHDSGEHPGRNWLALGIQGLAPYWFEIDATAYAGENGRSALHLSAEYELLLTQKLVLQPRVEASLYGKRDAERAQGSGLSDAVAGLRLRYEIRREFAPYIGVEYAAKFGDTADYAKAAGEDTGQTRWVAGLRFWY